MLHLEITYTTLKILIKIESVATLRKPCKTSCLLPNKTQKGLLHFESTRNTNDSKRPETLKTTNVCFHNKRDMSWLQIYITYTTLKKYLKHFGYVGAHVSTGSGSSVGRQKKFGGSLSRVCVGFRLYLY
jgi:hypothetical protein